jgi:hypothetical protein
VKFVIEGKTGGRYLLDKKQIGWELYKWREAVPLTKGKNVGKMSTEGYRTMGKYPHDMEHALKIVADDYMTETGGKFSFTEGLKAVKAFMESVKIKSLEVK